MASSSELVVKIPDLSNRMNSLIQRLGTDDALMANFGAKPADVVLENVLKGFDVDLSQAQLSASNKFLQSALKNASFREWATSYQRNLRGQAFNSAGDVDVSKLDRKKVLEDIAQALLNSGDRNLVVDWSEHLSNSRRLPDSVVVTDDIAVVTKGVAVLLVVVTAIDVTPYVPQDLDRVFVAPSDIRALSDAIVTSMPKD